MIWIFFYLSWFLVATSWFSDAMEVSGAEVRVEYGQSSGLEACRSLTKCGEGMETPVLPCVLCEIDLFWIKGKSKRGEK